MISKHQFLKESRKLGLPEESLKVFYDAFEAMREIVKTAYPAWEKLSADDWTKILEIEEQLQWPVLRELGDPYLHIYQDIDPAKRAEAANFLSSINREIELRKNKLSIEPAHYFASLKSLIEQRFEFLLTIFEIDKKTNWWLVAAIAGGAVAGSVYFFSKHKKEEKK